MNKLIKAHLGDLQTMLFLSDMMKEQKGILLVLAKFWALHCLNEAFSVKAFH